MKSFDQYNPIAVAVYFLTVAGIAMFCIDPILLSLSFLGALSLFFARNGRRRLSLHLSLLALFLVSALINPIFNHNGVTVLLVVNDAPITAEAIAYGAVSALMIVTVIYWFSSFTQIMDSDKLLYLLGGISPKLALVISMSFRYVPLFSKQAKRINHAQTALGLYREDNVIDGIRGGARVFSAVTGWALENGVITARSMSARGYGTGKRTRFSLFRFHLSDGILLVISLLLGGICAVCIGTGAIGFDFYPAVRMAELTPVSIAGYISYGALALLPTVIEMEAKIRWKYLISKI